MRYIYTTFILLLTCAVEGKNLEAYFSYSTFYSPQNGPYLETYLSVMGRSVEYIKNENGKYQGSLEIIFLFKQDEEIKKFKKYNLLSPELDDTLGAYINFIDQQRISLANGKYDFEIQIADNHSTNSAFITNQALELNYNNSTIMCSDIQLVESYKKAENPNILTKSGYDLVPFVANFYSESREEIIFYTEIYNTSYVLGENEKYLLNYYLQSYETGRPVKDKKGFVRQSAQKVNVLLNKFKIDDVPSGNYMLIVEVRDRENELLMEQKLFFQRSNPSLKIDKEDITSKNIANTFVENITSKDTLYGYIRSTRPVANEMERNFIDNYLKEADIDLMQRFFFSFWENRNTLEPEREWLKYNQEVKKVNKEFSTFIMKGYDTDRGRVYLKYGPPDTRTKRYNEPSAYPYEMWHYYQVPNRSNAKFVFYNRDVVSNDFALLHSNVLGEINDYQWQVKLQKRSFQPNDLDTEKPGERHFGSQQDELWLNPR